MTHTKIKKERSLISNKFTRNFFRISLIIGLFVVFASNLAAQVGSGSTSPESKNTSNKADQSLKSIARVNPSTLAMEFSLPLVNYPGRNGNSLPVSFSYSSKVWRMETGLQWWYWQNTQPRYVTDIHAGFAERSAAGWTSSLTPPRIDEKTEIYDQYGQPYVENLFNEAGMSSNWQNVLSGFGSNLLQVCGTHCSAIIWYNDGTSDCVRYTVNWCETGGGGGGPVLPEPPPPTPFYYVKRLQVILSDGSSHEFRQNDSPINCGNNQTGCSTDLDGTYLSVDGSGMRLVRDDDENNPILYTLFLPGGDKYTFLANTAGEGIYANDYTDVNGNKSSFNRIPATNTAQAINKWTDTLGREISDPMPQNWITQTQVAGTKNVGFPSLNGQTQDYKITWANLKPVGCEEDTNVVCQGANNVTGGALEFQTQKLFYETRYACRGNISNELLVNTNINQLYDPPNEVLFPEKETGIRPCNGFNIQRNPDGTPVLDGNGSAIPTTPRFNPVVLSKVEIPGGKSYEFKYNRYGEISKIIYPTGSFETFEYFKIEAVDGAGIGAYGQTNRGVKTLRIYEAGSSTPTQTYTYDWQFNYASGGNSYTKVTTIASKQNDSSANGIKTERYLQINTDLNPYYGFGNPLAGMPGEEKTYDENGALRSRSLTEWTYTGPLTGGVSNAKRDARPLKTISIVIENGQALATMSETEYVNPDTDAGVPSDPSYFARLNVKRSKSHHYRNISTSLAETGTFSQIAAYFSSSTVSAISETDYLYDGNYKNNGITSLAKESRVINPSNNEVLAKTQTIYDTNFPTVTSTTPYSGQENYGISGSMSCPTSSGSISCWVSPGAATPLARPTTSRVWDSVNNVWIESHTQYDIFGNAVKAKDAIGNEVQTIYENTAAKPYLYAYPTKVIASAPDPTGIHGTSETSTAETTYDFMTGLVLKVKDNFGQETQTEYNDPLLRPTEASGVGSLVIPISQTIYDDNALTVKVRKQIDQTTWDEATSYSDSLGRTYKTVATDSQGTIIVETKYDKTGKVTEVSNPYRQGDAVLWSKTRYDELGRAVESFAPAPAGTTGNSLGITEYGISTEPGFVGTFVTTTDAANKKGRAFSNALGQLVRVDEPDYQGGLTPVATSTPNPIPSPSPTPGGGGGGNCVLPDPNQCLNGAGDQYPMGSTYYKYNAQGKMVEVTQGNQKRFFLYDSMGRLVRVRQPEQQVNANLNLTDTITGNNQWTAGFSYDGIGNLIKTTDAEGVNTISEYDKASRVTMRCYTKQNISTAAANCAQVGSGNLSGNTPSVEYFYDGKGLTAPQTPNYAKGKLTKVTSSISETRYTLFDNFGRLTQSQQMTDGQTYTSGYEYDFGGRLIKETYPSGREVKNEFEADGDLMRVFGKANSNAAEKTYVNSFSYTAAGGISRMKLGNGKWETAKFNDRLQVEELGLGNSSTDASIWKVNYEYGEIEDNGSLSLNKNTGNIARQTLTFAGLTNPLVQTYKYDSLYRLKETKETSASNQNWIQNYNYDRYGNRIGFSENIGGISKTTTPAIDAQTNRFTSTDFSYDKIGNITHDISRTNQARDYVFNGDNKQTEIKDANGNAIGRYFYDGEGKRVKKVTDTETTIFVYSGGKLVAEYSTKLSQTPTTSYTTTDHLGTPRIITDASGQVKARRDFMPFGEELSINVGARSNALKYGTTDDIRQKFTGYQKDTETDLDFAEARMYENRYARFTAVDPLLASGKSANPQTFNRYVYVGNNPITRTDSEGLDWYDYAVENLRYGRTTYVSHIPVWQDSSFIGKPRWTRGVYRAHAGKSKGKYIAIDPYNNNWKAYKTRAAAEKAYQGFISQRNADATAGAAHVFADQIDSAISTAANRYSFGLAGNFQPFHNLTNSAVSGVTGANPNETSDVYTGTYRLITAGSAVAEIVAGEAVPNLLGSRLNRFSFAAEAPASSRCFVAGTLIHTENGLVPIEKIKAGDKVLSYNEDGRQVEYQTVVRTFVNHSSNLFEVRVEGQSEPIVVTNGHPFYVHRVRSNLSADEGEWINSDKLEVGDLVLRPDGGWVKVLSINQVFGEAAVYNFEVEQNHDYFVGSQGVLVHNTGDCGRGLWELTTENSSETANHSTFGKFYKHDSTELWWSRDIAGHGKSVFKVHEETSRGLKWLADADEYGDFILNKHKGSTGEFIPWSHLH